MRIITILVILAFIVLAATLSANSSGRSPCGEAYIVQEGDTLASIAQMCQVSLAALQAQNPLVTGDELLFVGRILKIPPSDMEIAVVGREDADTAADAAGVVPTAPPLVIPVTGEEQPPAPLPPQPDSAPQPAPTQPAPAQPVIAPSGGATTYVVQQCDTLFGIARYYGTSVDRIVALNPQITDPDRIDVGQVINIPLQ